MYIQSLHIEDLKCFRGTHDLDLTRPDGSYAGWTVVAGRNGSGKTTLLKALAFTVAGGWSALDARMHTQFINKKTTGQISVKSTSHEHYDDKTSQFKLAKFPNKFSWEYNHYKFDNPIPMRLSEAYKMPNPESAPTRKHGWFLTAWGAHRYLGPYNPSDDYIAKNDALAPISHLFMDTPTLVNALDWLKELRFKELEQDTQASALLKRAMALVNDGLLPDGVKIQGVSSRGVTARRGDGEEQLLPEIAAGYATVASLVLDLVRHLHNGFGAELFEASWTGTACELPGVVLIDEVEAHLHVSWQQKIGPWLCEHFPAIQFIVTTHSPFICQAASPAGLIRLPSPGTEEKIRHVSPEVYKAVVHGDVGDAVMSELFGLEHAHSQRTEDIYEALGELESKLLFDEPLTPAEEARRAELLAELPQDMGSMAEIKLRGLVEGLDAKDQPKIAGAGDAQDVGKENEADNGPRKPRRKSPKG